MSSLEGISRSMPAGLARQWESLSEEEDPYIYQSDLLTLGRRAWEEDRPELAARIFAYLKDNSAFPSISKKATRELDGVTGKGPLGIRLEYASRDFIKQLQDPTLYAAMLLGQGAFRFTRFRLGGWVAQQTWAPLLGGLGVRALANGGALTAEALTFSSSLRGIRTVWNPQGADTTTPFLQDFYSTFLLLGALRLSHWGSAALHHGIHGTVPWTGTARFEQALFTDMGTLTGLNLSHYLGVQWGLYPDQDAGQALFHSLATLLHFKAAGALLQPLAHRYLPLVPESAYEWNIAPRKTMPLPGLKPYFMSIESGKNLPGYRPKESPLGTSGIRAKYEWRLPRSLEYQNEEGTVRKFNYDVLLQPFERFEEVGQEGTIAIRSGRNILARVEHSDLAPIRHDYYPYGSRVVELSLSEGEGPRGKAILFLEPNRTNLYLIDTHFMTHRGVGGIFMDWLSTQAAFNGKELRIFKIINPKIFPLLLRYQIFDPQHAYLESCFEDHSGWEGGRPGLFYDPNLLKTIPAAHFHNVYGKPNPKLLPSELRIK